MQDCEKNGRPCLERRRQEREEWKQALNFQMYKMAANPGNNFESGWYLNSLLPVICPRFRVAGYAFLGILQVPPGRNRVEPNPRQPMWAYKSDPRPVQVPRKSLDLRELLSPCTDTHAS